MRIYWVCRKVWRSDRPKAMWRRGRPVVNDFGHDEPLFFRRYSNELEEGRIGKETSGRIPVPDQSVNRKKHGGRFWHALIPAPNAPADRIKTWIGQGVLEVPIVAVPPPTIIEGTEFSFQVEHDPEDHNYGHCEIRMYRDGKRISKNEADAEKKDAKHRIRMAKKYYRAAFVGKTILRIVPDVSTKGG
jgi:hypothetical protein